MVFKWSLCKVGIFYSWYKDYGAKLPLGNEEEQHNLDNNVTFFDYFEEEDLYLGQKKIQVITIDFYSLGCN